MKDTLYSMDIQGRYSNYISINNNSMKNLSTTGWIALALTIVGALNWGLVGAFSFDLVATLLGDMSALSRIVYGLVGISGIFILFQIFSSDR